MRRGALLAVLALAGCGGGGESAAPVRSTLEGTLADPDGDAALDPAPGEPLRDRTDLTPADDPGATLATLAIMTDLHVRDEESPARVPFLDRYGEPFQPAFRPQEALSEQVVAAAVRATNRQAPDAVIVTGDIVDNAQRNELENALALLDGGEVHPDSGGAGGLYSGVQAGNNPDPFFYRPDVDPPRHPGVLDEAQEPFTAAGLDAPWFAALGNHDVLLQGELPPTARTDVIAAGGELITALDPRAELPESATTEEAVDALLGAAEGGRTIDVPADPARASVPAAEMVRALARGRATRVPERLDYTVEVGPVRLVFVDVVNRAGGAEPVVDEAQLAWLRDQMGDGPTIIVTHQPPPEPVLAVADESPGVVAVVHGHTHTNRLEPRGSYWIVGTASLADYPMQVRMLRIREHSIDTWMVDQDGRGLAGTARELAFIDAQGGRPGGFAGAAEDRNARLFLP